MVLIFAVSLGTTGMAVAGGDWHPSNHILREAAKVLGFGTTYTESIDMLFDVKSGGALSLGTTNGSVRVETWAHEKIRLVITKSARASNAYDAKTLLANFLVHTKHEGKDLRLRAVARTKECKETVGVNITVWVPKSYNVEIKTEKGSIDIARLNGKFTAHTNEGKINLGYDPEDGLDIEVEDRTSAADAAQSSLDATEGSPATEEEVAPAAGDDGATGPKNTATSDGARYEHP